MLSFAFPSIGFNWRTSFSSCVTSTATIICPSVTTACALYPCSYPVRVFIILLSGSVTLAFASLFITSSGSMGFLPRFFFPVSVSSSSRASILAFCFASFPAASLSNRSLHSLSLDKRLLLSLSPSGNSSPRFSLPYSLSSSSSLISASFSIFFTSSSMWLIVLLEDSDVLPFIFVPSIATTPTFNSPASPHNLKTSMNIFPTSSSFDCLNRDIELWSGALFAVITLNPISLSHKRSIFLLDLSPKQYAYNKRFIIIRGLYEARPHPSDLCLLYILLKSICSTASIINHTKSPSDNHSLKSGGSKYPCSRLHSIKLYAICFPPESFVDNCSLII